MHLENCSRMQTCMKYVCLNVSPHVRHIVVIIGCHDVVWISGNCRQSFIPFHPAHLYGSLIVVSSRCQHNFGHIESLEQLAYRSRIHAQERVDQLPYGIFTVDRIQLVDLPPLQSVFEYSIVIIDLQSNTECQRVDLKMR
jgi:hypothetical protein